MKSAHAASGDGVGGQVIGVVSAGATSVDASNCTFDSSVQTGDAEANNLGLEFAGLNNFVLPADGIAESSDIDGVPFASYLQDGNDRRTSSQTAEATTGDAVAGQVAGVVAASVVRRAWFSPTTRTRSTQPRATATSTMRTSGSRVWPRPAA